MYYNNVVDGILYVFPAVHPCMCRCTLYKVYYYISLDLYMWCV